MDAQGRVLLAGILYRATLRGFAGELASRKLGAVSAEDKMRLHRLVEERAWDLPESAVAAVEGRDVDDGVAGLPELEAEVARLVEAALAQRRAT